MPAGPMVRITCPGITPLPSRGICKVHFTESDPAAPHVPFPSSGSYPVRTGNLVRPLVDGEPTFRRICEAIEGAHHSVWITVTFLRPGFQMPDGRGSFFDVLDGAVERGLDVRVLFWRHDPETRRHAPGVFWGSSEQREMLASRGSRFMARWDRAHAGFCQHQKAWLVDAGHDSETAFVGGINLSPHSMASPGHTGQGRHHDAYVELRGPAATDVHHNLVQRWNEASERTLDDGAWACGRDDDLAFPTRLSSEVGESPVQVQRTVHAGRYRDGRPSPGGRPFDIASGERSIFDQYRLAIGTARSSIYLENQFVLVPEVVAGLEQALERGVDVVVLVPAVPEDRLGAAALATLGRHEGFALAGIAGRDADGERHEVYVHAKVMLVDDAWATIGSCNLHAWSLFGNSEMNASFWDPAVVRGLRCELLAEHLGLDTAHLDDRAALAEYRRVAGENRRRRGIGDRNWQGLAFSLDPATYGL